LSTYTERVMASALRVHGFAGLVEAIRTPPPWLRLGRLDDAVNTVEMFVHAEDVRRAGGGAAAPRPQPPGFEAAVWQRLSRMARLLYRRAPAEVLLAPEGTAPTRVGRGGPAVTVSGRASEILLLSYNRKEHAVVELDGPGAPALRAARLGL
jgi:uncharacterized protein (TIGR03085 family)